MFADDEGDAPATMVGPGAVVHGAAAELGVEEQQHIVADLVLPEISKEAINIARDILQQVGVAHRLVGMGVEDVVGSRGEQNPRAEVGVVDLHHVLQVTPDRAAAVLDGRRVHSGGGAQYIGPLQRLDAGAPDVVVYGPSADGWGVHSAEDV